MIQRAVEDRRGGGQISVSADGFFSRVLGRDTDEYYSGGYYQSEEVETGRSRRSGSRRGVADEEELLPPGVPQESAVLIVRRTLAAAGVTLSELDASTQAQQSKLNSEIGFARNRQEEVRQKTQGQVRSLEEEIRKAKEACEDIVSYEEKKVSRAWATLEGVRRVRAFFELHETEAEEDTGPLDEDTTHILKPVEVDRAQISDKPL